MQCDIRDEYFEWLSKLVCGDRFAKRNSFNELLSKLHTINFRYSIRKDQNRSEDGISLRRRFAITHDYEHIYDWVMGELDGPCSVLEMMIALAIRCEENIMDDPSKGDRTAQWFWEMINNLGLSGMIDSRFDEEYVKTVIRRFLDRKYEPDGKGGLFRIRNCDYDLRTIEIWYQLCWYLDTIS